jgi:outer membrane immunogenic protein
MRKLGPLALLAAATVGAYFGSVAASNDALAQQNNNGSAGTPYNWSGPYAGGNFGGAWGGSDVLSVIPSGVPFFEGQFYPGVVNTATPGIIKAYRSNEVEVQSFTGGLQTGYNFWAGGLLIGFELEVQFLNGESSKTTRALGFNDPVVGQATYTFRNQIDVDYIFSARPRIGVLVGSGLLYGTGGVAFTKLKYEHSFRGTGGFFAGGPDIVETASVTENKIGFTLGGGYELPIGPNTTFKLEYIMTAFGPIKSSGNKINPLDASPAPPDFACGADTNQGGAGGTFPFLPNPTPRQCFNHKADLLLHSLRLGLNFKF